MVHDHEGFVMILLRLIGDNRCSIESLKLLCLIVMATTEEISVRGYGRDCDCD